MSEQYLTNKLRLTDAGKQAMMNADAGGILVNPKQYKLGTYDGNPLSLVPDDLLTPAVDAGGIYYIEVLDDQTVRFTIDVPASVGTEEGIPLGEIMLYFDDGTPFAHAQLLTPYLKIAGRGVRFDATLHIEEGLSNTINVTMSEHGSIPSIPDVNYLPDPLSANVNAISVLNLQHNSDGKASPGIASKFGASGQHWGFMGYDRVFSGTLGGGNTLSPSSFKKTTIVEAHGLKDTETFLVQVVSGAGAGSTRKFKLDGDDEDSVFNAVDAGMPDLADSSIISIWRSPLRVAGDVTNACPWPPEGDGIPAHWILQKGTNCPEWVPSHSAGKANSTKLYHAPSRLNMKSLAMVGTSDKYRYELADHMPLNGNHIIVSLQGVRQHRTSFEQWLNYLEFSELMPNSTSMDLRIFTEEESTGTMLRFVTRHHVCDGVTTRYAIGATISNPGEVLVSLSRILQNLSAYVYDNDTQEIVFLEAPPSGTSLETCAATYEQVEGFTTRIRTANYRTQERTNIIDLPFAPESKDQLFITENGMNVHKDQFSLSGKRVAFTGEIPKSRTIEVMYFQNVRTEGSIYTDLPGVVTDIIPTAKGFQILRHNETPLRLNMPEIDFEAGSGITVTGQFPHYKISSDFAEQVKQDKINSFNLQQVVEDTVEVTVSQRVKFQGDIVIQATADFAAELGDGFVSESGQERIEFVLGFRTTGQNEADYGRGIKGTGENGFSSIDPTQSSAIAYSNSNVTQTWNIRKANHKAGYLDIVAKMRVKEASLANYKSRLTAGLNILVLPQLG